MTGMGPSEQKGHQAGWAQEDEQQPASGVTDTSLISPLSYVPTESSDSIQTVRPFKGLQSPSVVLRTPSYPFPTIGIDSGTPPVATPPAHHPFTDLSPTVAPTTQGKPASKLAKARIADEFKASGRMSPSVSTPLHPATNPAGQPFPNAYEIAIRLQTEPGLHGWWQQVTQILRESVCASRAALAIPSDKTEIENVPWAQLAEYTAAGEDENLSRFATDAGSARSSLSGSFMNDASLDEQKLPKPSAFSPVLPPVAPVRPRLDTRHSYAGYPPKSPATEVPTISRQRPQPSRTTSTRSLAGILSEAKAFPEVERTARDAILSPLSEDTSASGPPAARVLDYTRPLEADIEPLITSAGVVRVLNNSSATVLTRKYNALDEAQEASPTSQKLPSRGSQIQLNSGDTKAARPNTRTRSGTSSTVKSSSNSSSEAQAQRRRNMAKNNYEDFEQIPGTPWAQSPAPSPAPAPEVEDNPFFSSQSVKESFRKNVPSQQYQEGQQFEAIGMDSSYSIIQLPLVHPSNLLSQPQRLHQFREEKNRDHRHKLTRSLSTVQSGADRRKKVPLAILSVMVPIVPFPQDCIVFLNFLSSLLATSFYAASQHTNLQKEVSGLSHERNRLAARAPTRMESAGSGMFSPLSAASSEYIAAASPQGPDASSKNQRTTESDQPKIRTPNARTPLWTTSREGYFGNVEPDQSGPSRHSSVRSRTDKTTKKAQSKLHSQGADFHKTHPSLPTSIAADPENDLSEDDGGPRPFKEPSSNMLRSIIDIGAAQHFIVEPDSGRLLWVNSKFQTYRSNFAGQKLDDLFWDNIDKKDRKNFRREWTYALENGEQLSQQVRLIRFDGQPRWFHLKFVPLKNDLGIIKYWSGQAMDIHDLHEAENRATKAKEKAASEAKYRAIANSLPVIVFAASVPMGMTFANDLWLSYSGQSLDQALGFGFLDHVHPDDLNKCKFPGMGGSMSTHNAFKNDPKVTSQRDILKRTDSGTSSAGESDAASTTTERTAKPQEPIEQQSEDIDMEIPNQLLKDLIKEGIIYCTRDGQGHISITTEMRLKAKDGDYRWHLVQGSYIDAVNFGQGDAQWFIACTDISNQKKNELKIQEANSALENVNTALEREMQQKMGYLSSMSHEIRTPLNSIIGNLQFLIQSGLEENALEWAHGAKEAATSMHELINDILDLSKAEAKMLKLSSHWFNPRDLGEQILDILNAKAAGKKVELCQEVASNVPHNIRGDAGRMRQVLLNLATNAIKFTNKGEVIVRCEIQHEAPAHLGLKALKDNEIFIRWVVTDTGIGFTEQEKVMLFKAYSQIKNKATRDTNGTGLGLILCKTMVNLHGGEIEASSVPGEGSVFSFFARFRIKRNISNSGDAVPMQPGSIINLPPAAVTTTDAWTSLAASPTSLRLSISSQGSPGPSSDGSSILSLRSSSLAKSVRSSISTFEASRPQSPLKLSLPIEAISSDSESSAMPDTPGAEAMLDKIQQQNRSLTSSLPKSEPLAPLTTTTIAQAPTAAELSQLGASASLNKRPMISVDNVPDADRASFRPPMLSILLICPPTETRRITCERIQNVVPRSAPCNIASEDSIASAYKLLFGSEPVLFTHIVIRTVVDDDALSCVKRILASPENAKACIVILTDQNQFLTIKRGLPDIDFESMNQHDRIKKVLKPAHESKLAKIFDPFNENRTTIQENPREVKRKAGEKRSKEDFKLFKRALGGNRFKVLAVEDDKMQMNILNSFLSKVCGLNVITANNGQEALDLYLKYGPRHFSVIVSDTEMPIMDGLTMCRRLREEESKRGWAPSNVVSLSANIMSKGWKEASAAGFSHYCGKPVSFSELGRILIELTDPRLPHRYLRDRPKPKAVLKALGELDSDDDESGDDEDADSSYPERS